MTAQGVFRVEIFHLDLVARLTPKYFFPNLFLPLFSERG